MDAGAQHRCTLCVMVFYCSLTARARGLVCLFFLACSACVVLLAGLVVRKSVGGGCGVGLNFFFDLKIF